MFILFGLVIRQRLGTLNPYWAPFLDGNWIIDIVTCSKLTIETLEQGVSHVQN